MCIKYFLINWNSLFWSLRILCLLVQPHLADLILIISHPSHTQQPRWFQVQSQVTPRCLETQSICWALLLLAPNLTHILASNSIGILQGPCSLLHYHSDLACFLFVCFLPKYFCLSKSQVSSPKIIYLYKKVYIPGVKNKTNFSSKSSFTSCASLSLFL